MTRISQLRSSTIELADGGYIHGVCCRRFLAIAFLHRFFSVCCYGIVHVPSLLHTNDYEAHIDTATALNGISHCLNPGFEDQLSAALHFVL